MPLRLQASLIVITALIASAPALAQEKPDGDLIGSNSEYTVADGDNLSDIARKTRVGLTELLAANPAVSSKTIHAGLKLTIPGQKLMPSGARQGTIVNLAALRLYHFKPDGSVLSAPISVGREGWDTPTGTTKIVQKRKDPTWTVPASIRKENPKLPAKVGPGPDNPLGLYALNLGWPGYLIHGTDKPSSVGKPSSHGCIRLYPEDIEALFKEANVGNNVTVVDTPITIGQSQGLVYLQVTPTRDQAAMIVSFADATPLAMNDNRVQSLKKQLALLTAKGASIDAQKVDDAITRHDGIPVAIGRLAQTTPSPNVAARTVPGSWWDQTLEAARTAWSNLTASR